MKKKLQSKRCFLSFFSGWRREQVVLCYLCLKKSKLSSGRSYLYVWRSRFKIICIMFCLSFYYLKILVGFLNFDIIIMDKKWFTPFGMDFYFINLLFILRSHCIGLINIQNIVCGALQKGSPPRSSPQGVTHGIVVVLCPKV